MNLRCPTCKQNLEKAYLCPNQHTFRIENEVLCLLSASFEQHLQHFLDHFHVFRAEEGRRIIDPKLYAALPYVLANEVEWRLRTYDLTVIHHVLTSKTGLHVADIGAWNGWLSYHLTKMGHDVTAMDYFIDEFDGLSAMKHYPIKWRAIQMDLDDLAVFIEPFDILIVNRCLQFFSDPIAYLVKAQQHVKQNGKMILTGLQFFADPRKKAQQVKIYQEYTLKKYGFEIFLKPTKGYLDWHDKEELQQLGVNLRPYPQTWAANLKSLVYPSLPRHYYGIWSPNL